jgi:hypothetical protein
VECFVVTHTRDGLWSVSHQERIICAYWTEAEALSATFAAAANCRRAGAETAVILTRARADDKLYGPPINLPASLRPYALADPSRRG